MPRFTPEERANFYKDRIGLYGKALIDKLSKLPPEQYMVMNHLIARYGADTAAEMLERGSSKENPAIMVDVTEAEKKRRASAISALGMKEGELLSKEIGAKTTGEEGHALTPVEHGLTGTALNAYYGLKGLIGKLTGAEYMYDPEYRYNAGLYGTGMGAIESGYNFGEKVTSDVASFLPHLVMMLGGIGGAAAGSKALSGLSTTAKTLGIGGAVLGEFGNPETSLLSDIPRAAGSAALTAAAMSGPEAVAAGKGLVQRAVTDTLIDTGAYLMNAAIHGQKVTFEDLARNLISNTMFLGIQEGSARLRLHQANSSIDNYKSVAGAGDTDNLERMTKMLESGRVSQEEYDKFKGSLEKTENAIIGALLDPNISRADKMRVIDKYSKVAGREKGRLLYNIAGNDFQRKMKPTVIFKALKKAFPNATWSGDLPKAVDLADRMAEFDAYKIYDPKTTQVDGEPGLFIPPILYGIDQAKAKSQDYYRLVAEGKERVLENTPDDPSKNYPMMRQIYDGEHLTTDGLRYAIAELMPNRPEAEQRGMFNHIWNIAEFMKHEQGMLDTPTDRYLGQVVRGIETVRDDTNNIKISDLSRYFGIAPEEVIQAFGLKADADGNIKFDESAGDSLAQFIGPVAVMRMIDAGLVDPVKDYTEIDDKTLNEYERIMKRVQTYRKLEGNTDLMPLTSSPQNRENELYGRTGVRQDVGAGKVIALPSRLVHLGPRYMDVIFDTLHASGSNKTDLPTLLGANHFLFKIYPELTKVNVVLGEKSMKNAGEYHLAKSSVFRGDNPTIYLSEDIKNKNHFVDVFHHELQHAIDELEWRLPNNGDLYKTYTRFIESHLYEKMKKVVSGRTFIKQVEELTASYRKAKDKGDELEISRILDNIPVGKIAKTIDRYFTSKYEGTAFYDMAKNAADMVKASVWDVVSDDSLKPDNPDNYIYTMFPDTGVKDIIRMGSAKNPKNFEVLRDYRDNVEHMASVHQKAANAKLPTFEEYKKAYGINPDQINIKGAQHDAEYSEVLANQAGLIAKSAYSMGADIRTIDDETLIGEEGYKSRDRLANKVQKDIISNNYTSPIWNLFFKSDVNGKLNRILKNVLTERAEWAEGTMRVSPNAARKNYDAGLVEAFYKLTNGYSLEESEEKLIKAFDEYLAFQRNDGVVKGLTTFSPKDGSAVIHLFKDADPVTLLHEMYHVLRRKLSPETRIVIEKELGVEGGKWTTETEEKFSEMMQTALLKDTPVSLDPDVNAAFRHLADDYRGVYETFSENGLVDPTPGVKRIFGNIVDLDKYRKNRNKIEQAVKNTKSKIYQHFIQDIMEEHSEDAYNLNLMEAADKVPRESIEKGIIENLNVSKSMFVDKNGFFDYGKLHEYAERKGLSYGGIVRAAIIKAGGDDIYLTKAEMKMATDHYLSTEDIPELGEDSYIGNNSIILYKRMRGKDWEKAVKEDVIRMYLDPEYSTKLVSESALLDRTIEYVAKIFEGDQKGIDEFLDGLEHNPRSIVDALKSGIETDPERFDKYEILIRRLDEWTAAVEAGRPFSEDMSPTRNAAVDSEDIIRDFTEAGTPEEDLRMTNTEDTFTEEEITKAVSNYEGSNLIQRKDLREPMLVKLKNYISKNYNNDKSKRAPLYTSELVTSYAIAQGIRPVSLSVDAVKYLNAIDKADSPENKEFEKFKNDINGIFGEAKGATQADINDFLKASYASARVVMAHRLASGTPRGQYDTHYQRFISGSKTGFEKLLQLSGADKVSPEDEAAAARRLAYAVVQTFGVKSAATGLQGVSSYIFSKGTFGFNGESRNYFSGKKSAALRDLFSKETGIPTSAFDEYAKNIMMYLKVNPRDAVSVYRNIPLSRKFIVNEEHAEYRKTMGDRFNKLANTLGSKYPAFQGNKGRILNKVFGTLAGSIGEEGIKNITHINDHFGGTGLYGASIGHILPNLKKLRIYHNMEYGVNKIKSIADLAKSDKTVDHIRKEGAEANKLIKELWMKRFLLSFEKYKKGDKAGLEDSSRSVVPREIEKVISTSGDNYTDAQNAYFRFIMDAFTSTRGNLNKAVEIFEKHKNDSTPKTFMEEVGKAVDDELEKRLVGGSGATGSFIDSVELFRSLFKSHKDLEIDVVQGDSLQYDPARHDKAVDGADSVYLDVYDPPYVLQSGYDGSRKVPVSVHESVYNVMSKTLEANKGRAYALYNDNSLNYEIFKATSLNAKDFEEKVGESPVNFVKAMMVKEGLLKNSLGYEVVQNSGRYEDIIVTDKPFFEGYPDSADPDFLAQGDVGSVRLINDIGVPLGQPALEKINVDIREKFTDPENILVGNSKFDDFIKRSVSAVTSKDMGFLSSLFRQPFWQKNPVIRQVFKIMQETDEVKQQLLSRHGASMHEIVRSIRDNNTQNVIVRKGGKKYYGDELAFNYLVWLSDNGGDATGKNKAGKLFTNEELGKIKIGMDNKDFIEYYRQSNLKDVWDEVLSKKGSLNINENIKTAYQNFHKSMESSREKYNATLLDGIVYKIRSFLSDDSKFKNNEEQADFVIRAVVKDGDEEFMDKITDYIDPSNKDIILKKMIHYSRYYKDSMIKPREFYAPRMREGDYVVYKPGDEQTEYLELFKNEYDAKRRAYELGPEYKMFTKSQAAKITGEVTDFLNYHKGILSYVEDNLQRALKSKQLSPEEIGNLIVKFEEEAWDLKNRRGFSERLLMREGVPGYDVDHYVQNFAKYLNSMANNMASRERLARLYGTLVVDPEMKPLFHSMGKREGNYLTDFISHMVGSADPTPMDKIVGITQSLMFVKHLAVNLGVGIAQETQALLAAVPMHAKLGVSRLHGVREITRAQRDLHKFLLVAFGDVNVSKRLTPGEASAIREAQEKGILDPQYVKSIMGAMKDNPSHILHKLSFALEGMDSLSRASAFLASYREAVKQGKSGKEAFDIAKEVTYEANFPMGRIGQMPITWGKSPGASLMRGMATFTNFSMNLLQLIHKYSIEPLFTYKNAAGEYVNPTARERAEALTNMLYMAAASAIVGGVSAIPFYHDILPEEVEKRVDKFLAEDKDNLIANSLSVIAKDGLPGLFGISVSSKVRYGKESIFFPLSGDNILTNFFDDFGRAVSFTKKGELDKAISMLPLPVVNKLARAARGISGAEYYGKQMHYITPDFQIKPFRYDAMEFLAKAFGVNIVKEEDMKAIINMDNYYERKIREEKDRLKEAAQKGKNARARKSYKELVELYNKYYKNRGKNTSPPVYLD